MKVTAIKINNILGIEHLEIKPGALTVIQGENGAGKTSVLEAIKAVIKGGHDATLLRNGASSGEVVLVLEDGVEIHKTVTAEKSNTSVIHPEHGKISRPAEYIKNLTDAVSVNPVTFLTLPPKERTDYLLEAMPLEVNPERVRAFTLDGNVPSGHAFYVLASLYDTLYMKRRDASRTAKEKKASIAELKKSLLPQEDEKDWPAEVKQLTQDGKDLVNEHKDKYQRAAKQYSQETEKIRGDYVSRKNEIHNEYVKKLEALNKWKETEIAKNNEKRNQEEQRLSAGLENVRLELEKVYLPQIDEKTAATARAQEKANESIRAHHTRDVINGFEKEVKKLDADVQLYSKGLLGIDAVKQQIMQDLPIKGLEVKDGEIYRDGVPFDRLNTMQQIEIAVEVVKLRTKELPLICVDGLERMDAAHIKTFEETIRAAGLQAIVTKVAAEGPLTVVNA